MVKGTSTLEETAARRGPSPIYVDEAVLPFRGLLMAHVFSRDLAALHAMAERLGVRRWFQDPATMKVSWPHYDISAETRQRAIALGVIPVSKYQMLAMARHIAGRPQQQVHFPPMAAALAWLQSEIAADPAVAARPPQGGLGKQPVSLPREIP